MEAERGKLKKRGAIMVVGDMQRARKVAASLRLPEVKWMERRPARVQRSYFDCRWHYDWWVWSPRLEAAAAAAEPASGPWSQTTKVTTICILRDAARNIVSTRLARAHERRVS